MSKLFEPLTIKEVTLRNRITVSPMCQYSSSDGFANPWHMVHLGSRAVGGAGLIIAEATAVSPEGRITPADLGIWKDDHISQLSAITSFIHSQGAVAGIQLAHAGRKASRREPWNKDEKATKEDGGWQPVGPSSIAFGNYDVPEELTVADIQKVISDFVAAAKRAIQAGFKVIEIHGAHGYLLHEFYSPLSNHRKDEYGGSFENRIRLLVEIVAAVKTVWPANYPLFVRLSASDWVADGWQIEDTVALAKILKKEGVDLIDCSSGGNVPQVKIPVGPGYQVHFAEAVQQAGVMAGAVGMITDAHQAEEIIASGKAEIVLIARELLRDPYWPLHAAKELGVNVDWPIQYERAKR